MFVNVVLLFNEFNINLPVYFLLNLQILPKLKFCTCLNMLNYVFQCAWVFVITFVVVVVVSAWIVLDCLASNVDTSGDVCSFSTVLVISVNQCIFRADALVQGFSVVFLRLKHGWQVYVLSALSVKPKVSCKHFHRENIMTRNCISTGFALLPD